MRVVRSALRGGTLAGFAWSATPHESWLDFELDLAIGLAARGCVSSAVKGKVVHANIYKKKN